MRPHGTALAAFVHGDRDARVLIRRDDGLEIYLPASSFFREPAEFTPVEAAALDRCTGRVLDVGAGTGLHSLVLQSRGCRVSAIDISPEAVEVMRCRGIADAQCADVFEYEGGPFDVLLLLGHGIGMVETLAGLDRFLSCSQALLSPGGQILLHSLDVRVTCDPVHLAYHDSNRTAGRYIGETRLRLGYGDLIGPPCGWLHVDPETLEQHAVKCGWESRLILRAETGDYLATVMRAR